MTSSPGALTYMLNKYGIPHGWEEKTVDQLAKLFGGATPKREEGSYWNGGIIPWATPSDITAQKAKYISDTEDHITEAGLRSCSASLLPAGSILFTSRATIGAKAIATVPMATNQGFANLFPGKVHGDFLFYLLDFLTPVIKRLAAGTTFDEVNKRDIRKIRCAVPPPDEQETIACLLDTTDQAVDSSRIAIDRALNLKHGIVQRFLYNGIGKVAYADRAKKNLAPGWKIIPTRQLLRGDPKNGISPPASSKPPGLPTFSIAAVRDGFIDLKNQEHLKYVNINSKAASDNAVNEGDILIVRGNANPQLVGKCGMIREYPQNCIYPDILKRVFFRSDGDDIVLPEYAVLIWNHAVVHNQVLRRAKTSNGTLKINNRDVQQIVIPVAPTDQQEQLINLVRAVQRSIDALRTVLTCQQRLKCGLIRDLLTGHFRVGKLSDETITDRIAARSEILT